MDPSVAAATMAILNCVCVGAVLHLVEDKRVFQYSSRAHTNTFSCSAFDRALSAGHTQWFEKKLRCSKISLAVIFEHVHPMWPSKPHHNAKYSMFKRFALMLAYLAHGGQIDQAASLFGRSVVYVNEGIDTLKALERTAIAMPLHEKTVEIEAGFAKICWLPRRGGRNRLNPCEDPATK
ncbi:hypothetical protein PybrP1_009999 [[Pythium] brassicae (nom. inval.)]|nr:hypothetical protein PybrP1_009999 [[Pythium] brassicae (nom. inval.)]